jgi:hypothetical protein
MDDRCLWATAHARGLRCWSSAGHAYGNPPGSDGDALASTQPIIRDCHDDALATRGGDAHYRRAC